MNIKSIEAQLIEQADKKLKQEIEAAFQPAYNAVSSRAQSVEMSTDGGGKAAIRYYVAIEALKAVAFELKYERNRQDAINAFMAEVANLTTQLEDLQSQIQ